MKIPIKIVMLEDNETDAEIITRFLRKEKLDFESLLVSSRPSFINALGKLKPDVILADNSLPQFSGLEALKLVRETPGDIPFILVTGSMTDEFAADIMKSGADDYILKDRLTRLPDAIRSAIEKRRTERERADAINRLVQSEAKYRSLLESAPDAMVVVNNEGLIEMVNIQTEKMFGYSANELVGKRVRMLFPERFRESEMIANLEMYNSMRATQGFEFFARRNDGGEFPVEVRLSPFTTAEGTLTTAAVRDITERKQAETALKVMEQEILNQKIQEQKRIARAIIKAQEKERNRIGQELHDNVNQILAGTKLYLQIAKEDDLDVKQLIDSSLEMIDRSISEIRMLSARNVTPLKNINLEQLLLTMTERMNEASGTNVNLNYGAGDRPIDDDVKLNIYRIVQEQMNNILKHAEAKNVEVKVTPEDGKIRVLVADDGKGFDVNKKRKGIGISNMMNRVESFNGEFHFDSSPGAGCKIEMVLPC